METPNSSIPDEPPIHPLARREQDAYKDSTVDDRGFLSPLDPRAVSHLRVTAAGLGRAIKFLSALFFALEQCGHTLNWSTGPHMRLVAQIDGEEIAVRLAESVRLKPGTATKSFIRRRTSPKFDYRSSTLTLYLQSVEFYNVSRKRSDHRHQRMEDCIEDIVLEFTRAATAIKQAREDLERAHQEVEKRRLREAEERKQKQTYLQRAELITKTVQQFEMSQSIRRLVVCLGSSAKIDELNHDLFARFKEMLEWCTEYANALDPTNQLAGLVEEFSKQPTSW